MAWTTPRTWLNLEIVSHTLMNTHVRDNLQYVKDILDGAQSQTILIKAPTVIGLTVRNTGASDNISIRFMGNASAVEQWAIGNEIATGGTGRNFDVFDLVSSVNRLRITSGGQVLTNDGSASLPAHSFINDPDNGLYRVGADNWALTVGGTIATQVYKSGGNVQLLLPDGSAAAPLLAFAGASNTGIARIGAASVSLVGNGVEAFRAGGSGASPILGFYGNTGFVKQTVSGAKGSNAALGSLMAALATIGLIADATTA